MSHNQLTVLLRPPVTGGAGAGGGGGVASPGSATNTGGGPIPTPTPTVPDATGYEVRMTSDMPLSWSPTPQPPVVAEPHGTGSADYAVVATVPLSGDPTTSDGANGSGRLTWAKFAYSDQNVQELCQDGKYMNTGFEAAGSSPGTLTVTNLQVASPSGAAPDPGVTLDIKVDDPSEQIKISYAQGNTACKSFTATNTYHDWAQLYLAEGSYIGSGVSGFASQPSSASNVQNYELTGWQRASGPAGGGGTLVALKDLSYQIADHKGGNGTPGGTGTAHVQFEIVSVPQAATGTG
jgi:hypothetical protein